MEYQFSNLYCFVRYHQSRTSDGSMLRLVTGLSLREKEGSEGAGSVLGLLGLLVAKYFLSCVVNLSRMKTLGISIEGMFSARISVAIVRYD